MRTWVGTFVMVALLPAWASATPGLYRKVADLYSKAGVPSSADLKPEQLWLGKCVSRHHSEDKTNGGIFFHVELDPVVGDNFYAIPLLDLGENVTYSAEAEKVTQAIQRGYVRSVVVLDNQEKAWRTAYCDSNEREGHRYYIREGKSLKGDNVLYLKVRGADGEAHKYCYFYTPITGDSEGGDTPVTPPADPIQ